MKRRENSIRLIAEWEPQDAILLTWPSTASDWHDTLVEADRVYTQIALSILADEELIIVAADDSHQQHIAQQLHTEQRKPVIVTASSNDTWIRDYGPLSVEIDNHNQLVDFRFNAWGKKYPYQLDDKVSAQLAAMGLLATTRTSQLVLEGGALETNGRNTLLATRSSVISEERNPGLEQSSIEKALHDQLGIELFHWIDCEGLAGDDTDGHIDTLARFIDHETIVYITVEESHPDHAALLSVQDQLQALRQQDGSPYRLIPLPAPPLRYSRSDGRLLPATYANFLFTNHALLLPVYDDKQDEVAIRLFETLTQRTIIPINCNTLIDQNGSLHCATMQLAKGIINFDTIPL